ncbi:hypothetical protein [Sinosporangium siamense]|uniref:Uncharacterized protein n=1 Tax=Sinosporangium siamense TaxID=1367973 RepID=A0A919RLC7_9ACTN|nr:hypothetical protein [Sinosporangium siamense]GII94226.1 hypothetical protein Ssi02_44570 [Sinosporangium siamense]
MAGRWASAVADLLPDRTAAEEGTQALELPVTLDMPGKIADFLRTTELEPAERAALDQGVTVRRGQGYTLRVTAASAVHRRLRRTPPAPRPLPVARRRPGPCGSFPAQGPTRVRDPGQHPDALTMIVLTDNRCTDVPRGRFK